MIRMWNSENDRPRPPVSEPEILPPGAPEARRPGPEQVWMRQRVYIARPGPVAMVLGLIALVGLGIAGAVALVGVALLLLPAVALGVGALVLAALLRGPRRY